MRRLLPPRILLRVTSGAARLLFAVQHFPDRPARLAPVHDVGVGQLIRALTGRVEVGDDERDAVVVEPEALRVLLKGLLHPLVDATAPA